MDGYHDGAEMSDQMLKRENNYFIYLFINLYKGGNCHSRIL